MHISHYAQIFEHNNNYIYARETITPHLQSHSCFPDRLVILNELSWNTFRRQDSTRKRNFAEILENFLTGGHL